jgi:hypothetical protein
MHEKRREKVRGRLQNFIRRDRSAEQNGGLYDTNLLRSTADFISSGYSDDVSSNDIFRFLYLKEYEFLKQFENPNDDVGEGLKGVTVEQYEELESLILEELEDIPCEYKVRILLENSTNEPLMCLKLSHNAYLEVVEDETPNIFSAAMALGGAMTLRRIYLVLEVNGFCTSDSDCSVAVRTITNLKCFLFMAWIRYKTYNLEYRKKDEPLSSYDTHVLPKRYIEVLEPTRASNIQVRMPIDVSGFIANFGFRVPLAELEIEGLQKVLEETSPEFERVKAAMEWYIDSVISDASTVKFVQICIGLESLLGDEREDAPLTITLADRCAYLLAKNIKHRSEIRERFKKMYAVRSKIIHGSARNLRDHEKVHFEFARNMLREAILTELMHI